MNGSIQSFGTVEATPARAGDGFGPPREMAAEPPLRRSKDLGDYLRGLRLRLWMVVAVCLLLIPPGAILVLRQPDRYRATARIKIEPPHFDERVASIMPHGGVGQSSSDATVHYVPDQLAELRSPGLHETVASDPALNLTPPEIAEATAILSRLQTRQHPNSYTFDIYLDGDDAARVATLLNGLLRTFAHQAESASDDRIVRSEEQASRSITTLTRELQAIDQNINQLMAGSELFAPGGRSLVEEQYVTYQSLLMQKRQQYEHLIQQARIAKLAPSQGMGLAAISPQAQAVAQLEAQRDELAEMIATQRRTIRRYQTDPAARKAAYLYQQTNEALEQLQQVTVPREADLTYYTVNLAGDEVKRLEGQVKGLLDQMQRSMPQYQQYLSLLSERDHKQQSLVTTQERLSAFEMLAATANQPVELLVTAEEPTEPVGPNRKINMILVVLAGLGLGLGLVCGLEALDQRVKVPEELSMGLRLPLLGVVPRMRRLAAFDRGGHLWAGGLPRSIEADSFRNVRASLLGVTGARGRSPVTILVTSAKSGEGKSTAALNLATTCARSGERTLLLDADLRNPSLAGSFPSPQGYGLVDVLTGRQPWQRAVVRTDLPNLDFLAAGDPSEVPIEILGTLELAQLLRALAGHYHRVIVDGPAVLGLADCRILGRMVEATVLVVRGSTHALSPLLRTKQMLEQSQVRVAGVIFNGLNDDLHNWGTGPTLATAGVPAHASVGLSAPAGNGTAPVGVLS